MKLHTLLLTGAAIIALAACQPKSETDGAAPAVAPAPDIVAPAAPSGPAAPNSSDSLSTTPPPAAVPPSAVPPVVPPAPVPTSSPAAPPAAAGKVSAEAAATTPAQLANGRSVFAQSCAMCHGPTGGGTAMAPEVKLRDLAAIRDKVTRGAIKPDDKMPSIAAMGLSDTQISDVSKFVAAGLPQ